MPVDDCQSDHHKHRRQNEPAHGDNRATPSAQTQSDVSDGIARTRSRKTLRERESFGKIRVSQPATLTNSQRADLCEHSHAAAETNQADFEKG